jgi:hypothetical protein
MANISGKMAESGALFKQNRGSGSDGCNTLIRNFRRNAVILCEMRKKPEGEITSRSAATSYPCLSLRTSLPTCLMRQFLPVQLGANH